MKKENENKYSTKKQEALVLIACVLFLTLEIVFLYKIFK